MVEWGLGISVWVLLVAAVYFFFKNKFENMGELFEENSFEDDYEEAEEYEEYAWTEEYDGDWDESSVNESFWDESSGNADSWNDGDWDGNSWGEEAPEEPFVYYLEEPISENSAQNGRYIKEGKNRRRRKERRKRGMFGRLAIPLMLVGTVYLLLPYYCVRREMTIDAGEKCPGVEAFLNWGNNKASIVSKINESTVLDRSGDYGVIIEVYGRKVAAVLHVENTPGGTNGEINTVLLEIEDEVGNTTTAGVIDDTEPPVIHGVGELTMTAGGSISYKRGITVTDNYDQNVALNVDSSAVNVDKAGDYRVIYTAVDSAGNKASVATVLHVLPMTIDTVTEENIYAEADKLLETILTDSMSQYEQAKAIYNWCHSNIAYSDGTPKTNWVQGAYRGLVNRKGDCYVYAATAKCLLTRAGINNMDIEKITETSLHYWNLIDIGDGWHHFDTCRRKDGSTFFYKTDAELMEYSNAHNKSHDYDRSRYPEIK